MKYRLSNCPPGSEVIITELCGGTGALDNLKSLGLKLGDKTILSTDRAISGPLNLFFNGILISIGKELSSKIIVESNEEFPLTLAQTKAGDESEVTKINSNGDIRFRLLDMGLVRGVKIKTVRFAPLGDPISIELNGFNLSLRLNEAESIDIKMINFGSNGAEKKRGWWR